MAFKEDITKDNKKNVKGVSCKRRLQEINKEAGDCSSHSSVERALGFDSSYDLQCKLTGYNHLINASSVKATCQWLFENGYDIVKVKV